MENIASNIIVPPKTKYSGRFLVFKSNPRAYWLDDYDEVIQDYPMNLPYELYGPE